jgi:hypothetical protein
LVNPVPADVQHLTDVAFFLASVNCCYHFFPQLVTVWRRRASLHQLRRTANAIAKTVGSDIDLKKAPALVLEPYDA